MRRIIYPLLLIILLGLLLIVTQSLQLWAPVQTDNFVLLPELQPSPGFYNRRLRIQMIPSHPQGSIIYTIDGSKPSANSGTLYTQPIILDNTFASVSTIRAIEVVGDRISPIVTAIYALGIESDLPLAIITAEPNVLWDQDTGLLTHPERRGPEWECEVEFTLLDAGSSINPSQTAGVRIVGDPLLSPAKHTFRLYFRSEYGNPRLDINPFRVDTQQTNANLYKRLLLQPSRDEKAIRLITEQVVTDILTELGMPVAESRIVHLLINGNSWGLYRLTEHVDNILLEDNFNMTSADVVQEGNAREGTDEAWDNLLTWLSASDDTHALSDTGRIINLDNFITTSCIQKYLQLPPDAFYAVRPENGRWFWIYEGGGTVQERGSDLNNLYIYLSRDEEFRNRYATLCADLLNTNLATEHVISLYQRYSTTMSGHFNYEQIKWPHTPPWDVLESQQIEYLSNRESELRETLKEQLNLSDSVTLDFQVDPGTSGYIYLNGKKVNCDATRDTCRYTFFAGTQLNLQAVALPEYTFSDWQLISADGKTLSSYQQTFIFPLPSSSSDTSISAHFIPYAASKDILKPDDVHINEYWINDNGTRYASVEYRAIEGDWIELLVEKSGSADLRGWRITDNDNYNGTDEGSLILPDVESLAAVPKGTVILILATQTRSNDENFPEDDLRPKDRRLVMYVGNGNLDASSDSGFNLQPLNDNLALLAPGEGKGFDDDIVIDFVTEGNEVTAFSFGALKDSVTFDQVFTRLGNDDGVVLTVRGGNDQLQDWLVDPDSCMSGDELCANARNYVTPGKINPQQSIFW